MAKYLDDNGILYFWQKLKNYFDVKGSASSVLGSSSDTSSATTVYGAIALANSVSSAVQSAGYQNASQVQTAIDSALSNLTGVYKYMGTVATYADLPENASDGDVYNVTSSYGDYPSGTNWAWNGTAWDALGGSVDLSRYVQASDLVTITNAEIDTIVAS